MGASEFNAKGNPAMDQHPIQGGVEILLVTSCYRNRDKLWATCLKQTLPYLTCIKLGFIITSINTLLIQRLNHKIVSNRGMRNVLSVTKFQNKEM